jgi:hypothetical protein
MRELVGLVALFAALLGFCLIWSSENPRGMLGLLLLTGACLFLHYRVLSDSAQAGYQLLSQRISRLEDQLHTSRIEPMAEPDATVDGPRGCG